MKLWDKGFEVAADVDTFTVGRDRELDLLLAPWDIAGSLAHIAMLSDVGLLPVEDLHPLQAALRTLYKQAQAGELIIEDKVEDIHSQVELELTKLLGDAGKKIHSGRSRNDQVLVDLRLYYREVIREITDDIRTLAGLLLQLAETHQAVLLPGYTHFQVAMPSSFGLWFSAYAESLADDLVVLEAAYRLVNQNPLGSAAGYGSSFPLNREQTTRLLGFAGLNYNVVYAQMSRGKVERALTGAMSSVAATLNKLAADACLYLSQNFAFFSFPDHLTTGSSIMPHKKNPDVFELIRARTNQLQALPGEVALLTTNLPSGYHRDLQLLKEALLPAFTRLRDCLQMTTLMLREVKVNTQILDDPKYDYLFSVEEVNRLVLEGVPFREAYKQVGGRIQEGKFKPDKAVNHTHVGSIGNLALYQISTKLAAALAAFRFDEWQEAIEALTFSE